MSLCSSCGLQLTGDAAICPHHHAIYGDDWAVSNRIWNDFFIRGIVPARLTPTERDDAFYGYQGDVA